MEPVDVLSRSNQLVELVLDSLEAFRTQVSSIKIEPASVYGDAVVHVFQSTSLCLQAWYKLFVLLLSPVVEFVLIVIRSISPHILRFFRFLWQKQMDQPVEVWAIQAGVLFVILLFYVLRHFIIRYQIFEKLRRFLGRVSTKVDQILAEIAKTSKMAAEALPHFVLLAGFGFIWFMYPKPLIYSALLPAISIFVPVLRTLLATNLALRTELDKCTMYWVIWAFVKFCRALLSIGTSFVPNFIIPGTEWTDTLLFFLILWLLAPLGGLNSIYRITEPYIHSNLQTLSALDRRVDSFVTFVRPFLGGAAVILEVVHSSWMTMIAVPFAVAMYPLSNMALLYMCFAVPAIKSMNAISVKNFDVQFQWLAFFAVFGLVNWFSELTDFFNWIPLGFGIQLQMLLVFYLQVPPFSGAVRIYEFIETQIGDVLVLFDEGLSKFDPNIRKSIFGKSSTKHLKRASNGQISASSVKAQSAEEAKGLNGQKTEESRPSNGRRKSSSAPSQATRGVIEEDSAEKKPEE